MRYPVIHPVLTGALVGLLRAGFQTAGQAYSSNVTVADRKPRPTPRRLVTVRDDGGPDDTVFSVRRIGVNVWADDPVDAEKLALLAGAILRSANDDVVVHVDQISSPVRIDDETAETVAGKNLTHFYFAARPTVRGSQF